MARISRVASPSLALAAAVALVAAGSAAATTVTPVHYFSNGNSGGVVPYNLVSDSGGALYFLDHLNESADLVPQIVGLDPANGQITPLMLLPEDSDTAPGNDIAFAPNGMLYGIAYKGSQPTTSCGTIETYDIAAGTPTPVYTFPCGLVSGTTVTLPNGGYPSGILGFDPTGALIGTLSVGAGASGQGFFRFDPGTATTTSFAANLDPNKHGGVLHPNGLIYTTGLQAVGVNGDIFSVDPASGKTTDLGAIPLSPDIATVSSKFEPSGYDNGLSVDPSGIVWGVGQEIVYSTNKKGSKYHNACFVIFKFDPTTATAMLEQHLPCVYQRAEPVPVFDQSGAMYFDYALEGPRASHPKSQVIYKYVPSTNTLTALTKLRLKQDGYTLRLFVNPDGTLYGVAASGGKLTGGDIIKITP